MEIMDEKIFARLDEGAARSQGAHQTGREEVQGGLQGPLGTCEAQILLHPGFVERGNKKNEKYFCGKEPWQGKLALPSHTRNINI